MSLHPSIHPSINPPIYRVLVFPKWTGNKLTLQITCVPNAILTHSTTFLVLEVRFSIQIEEKLRVDVVFKSSGESQYYSVTVFAENKRRVLF